jgi:2-polyprenyl-3-methyl-5-hydroxy-6-metoxy-1,4-benzoquinol methylase
MPADYSILAPFYDTLGMGNFATALIPRVVDFAQRNGWVGRQIADMGCGTGAGLEWLAKHQKQVVGIDNAPQMLALAQQKHQQYTSSFQWMQQDIRALTSSINTHMVTAMDVLHEMESTKDLEAVFKSAHSLLQSAGWFIFDLYTIEGLVKLTEQDAMAHDSQALTVFQQNQFDYDRQMHSRRYLIFHQHNTTWQKQEVMRVLRSYPVQAITALLQRSGFQVLHVLNADLSRYEPNKLGTLRVIIMAEKR